MKMRKIISIVLVFILILSVFNIGLYADEKDNVKNEKEEITISDEDELKLLKGELTVEEYYEQHPDFKKQKDEDKKALAELKRSRHSQNNYVVPEIKEFPTLGLEQDAAENLKGISSEDIPVPTPAPSPGSTEELLKEEGKRLKEEDELCYISATQSFTDLADLIKNSIDNNNPVALLLGPQDIDDDYYDYFSNHWVTITGYSYHDDIYNITVSSWRRIYPIYGTIDLRDLVTSKIFAKAVCFYNY